MSRRKGRGASAVALKITSINTPMARCTQWSGMASAGDKNYEWFYEPRSYLHMREQDGRNPRCWMNIEPLKGARRVVLSAVRAARS